MLTTLCIMLLPAVLKKSKSIKLSRLHFRCSIKCGIWHHIKAHKDLITVNSNCIIYKSFISYTSCLPIFQYYWDTSAVLFSPLSSTTLWYIVYACMPCLITCKQMIIFMWFILQVFQSCIVDGFCYQDSHMYCILSKYVIIDFLYYITWTCIGLPPSTLNVMAFHTMVSFINFSDLHFQNQRLYNV